MPLSSTVGHFETAHTVLAEGGGSPVCVRLLRAWPHGEALYAAFLEVSLTKLFPSDAAHIITAMLYGQCSGIACSCHFIVACWKRTASVA